MSSPFACECGASGCVGEVRGFAHLRRAQQDALAPSASPYVQACLAEQRAGVAAA